MATVRASARSPAPARSTTAPAPPPSLSAPATAAGTFYGPMTNTSGTLSLARSRHRQRETLLGTSTYSGTNAISGGGILNIQNRSALGASTGLTIASGSELDLAGSVSISSTTALSAVAGTGFGVSGGAIASLSGSKALAGAITLSGPTTALWPPRIRASPAQRRITDGSLPTISLTVSGGRQCDDQFARGQRRRTDLQHRHWHDLQRRRHAVSSPAATPTAARPSSTGARSTSEPPPAWEVGRAPSP